MLTLSGPKTSRKIDWAERIGTRLSTGLVKTSLTTPSRWAENRLMLGPPLPGKWSFDYHPWLKEPMDARCDNIVTLKGAQLGFTTAAIGRVLFMLDVERLSVLYLLPTQRPDASEFSATKLQQVIDDSPEIAAMFTDVSSVGLKRSGSASLFIRGANSRNALKSISVGAIIFDEYDEMPPENIPLAEERTSGQFKSEIWRLSTPTIPGTGVDRDFQETTKEHFYFPCPYGCTISTRGREDTDKTRASSGTTKRLIKFSPDDLVVTAEELSDPNVKNSYVQTSCCNKKIEHKEKRFIIGKGKYQPEGHTDYSNRGFAVNQLYSSTMNPERIARLYLRAQVDPAAEQEYWNSKMGIAHETKGARLTDSIIDGCIKTDLSWGNTQWTTMGIDVGAQMHVIVRNWKLKQLGSDLNLYATSKLLLETKVEDPQQLDKLMRDFQVYMAVIDAQPERRMSIAFARRFPGHVRTCFYNTAEKGQTLSITDGDDDWRVTADRTFWLDTTFGAFKTNRIVLPGKLSIENRTQLKALVRVYREVKQAAGKQTSMSDAQKQPVAYYRNTGPDHYAHAWNYSEMALPLAVSKGTNRDLQFFL